MKNILSLKRKFRFCLAKKCVFDKKISQTSGISENIYSILWFSGKGRFCNKLILKTRVKIEVHPLSPPTLFLVSSNTTNFRGTRFEEM